MFIEQCVEKELENSWRLPQLKKGTTSYVHRQSLFGATLFGNEVFYLAFGNGNPKAGVSDDDILSMAQMNILAGSGKNTLLISSEFMLEFLIKAHRKLSDCTKVSLCSYEVATIEISAESVRFAKNQILTPIYYTNLVPPIEDDSFRL